ncbi:MAG: MBL fold metallo-hydrolase, partial [Bdellovibrionales bacterium]|nr:MBL fold metallo-hydrolase [Bdellovibrionales bacterium]
MQKVQAHVTEEAPLSYILLTAVTFKSVGGIPALREAFPNLALLASPRAAELLGEQATLTALREENLRYAEAFTDASIPDDSTWASAFEVNHIIRDGDAIELDDGVEIKVIGCHGFAEEGLAYYVRPDAILVGGEEVGVYAGRGKL